MTSRTVRRALISLVLVPWVSAAPAVQRSDLPLVKSLSATCDIDLSQIRHDLYTLAHSISEIIDSDGVTLPPPVGIVDVGEHSVSLLVIGLSILMCVTNALHTGRGCSVRRVNVFTDPVSLIPIGYVLVQIMISPQRQGFTSRRCTPADIVRHSDYQTKASL